VDYYEQLCKEFDKWAKSKAGRGHDNRKYLIYTPNFFILLCKLAHCPELTERSKAKIAIAISYFMLPFDLIPEAFLGPPGYIDDLVLTALTINFIRENDGKKIIKKIREYSDMDIFPVVDEIIDKAKDLVGESIYRKLVEKIQ
jgi:uncharacterized membrane protein YkvA (DUF1232 family)